MTARPATPQAGDFFVVATNGLVARLIRWFTGSWANHAGVYIGAGWIAEANPAGVQLAKASKYDSCRIEWSGIALTPEEREQVVGAVGAMEGIPYGYLDLLAIVLHRFRLTLWADRRLDRGDRLICSQVVARAYRVAGLTLMPGTPENYVTPGDLARLLEGGAPWASTSRQRTTSR